MGHLLRNEERLKQVKLLRLQSKLRQRRRCLRQHQVRSSSQLKQIQMRLGASYMKRIEQARKSKDAMDRPVARLSTHSMQVASLSISRQVITTKKVRTIVARATTIATTTTEAITGRAMSQSTEAEVAKSKSK